MSFEMKSILRSGLRHLVVGSVFALGSVVAIGALGISSDVMAQATSSGAVEIQPAADLPTAADLFAKHVAAVGGEKAVRSHKSSKTKATFNMPAMGMTADMLIYSAAPNKMYLDMTIPSMGSMQQGYDGKVGWSVDPMSGARVLSGEELKQMALQADFYADLNYKDHYKEMKTLEKTVFADRPSYRVHVVTTFGSETDFFFDVENGLLNGMESTAESQMGPVKSTTVLSEYKDFGGVKHAAKTTMSAFGQEQILTLNSVEYDGVEPSVFVLPEQIKTLAAEAKKADGDDDEDDDDHGEGDDDDDDGDGG